MKKNREQWASLIDKYNIRMEENRKIAEEQNAIIEEAKSENEEDSSSGSSESSDNVTFSENGEEVQNSFAK